MKKRRLPATYHPLMDAVRKHLNVKTDAELSARLGFHDSAVTFIRNGYRAVSDEMLISIHEETGFTFAHMRELLARKTEPAPVPEHSRHRLLDAIRAELAIASDARLAKRLDFDRGTIGGIRSHRIEPSDEFILRSHEASGIPIAELKKLAAQEARHG